MRKVSDRPNCCKEGSESIWWTDFHLLVGAKKGWYMIVGWDDKMKDEQGRIFRGVSYCPFCGKKLDWIDEMMVGEQEEA